MIAELGVRMFNKKKKNDDNWDMSNLASNITVQGRIKKSEANEAMNGFMELVYKLADYASEHRLMFACTVLDLEGEQGGMFMHVAREYADDFIEMAYDGMKESRERLGETGD